MQVGRLEIGHGNHQVAGTRRPLRSCVICQTDMRKRRQGGLTFFREGVDIIYFDVMTGW